MGSDRSENQHYSVRETPQGVARLTRAGTRKISRDFDFSIVGDNIATENVLRFTPRVIWRKGRGSPT